MELKEKNSSRDRKKDLSDILGINQLRNPLRFINGLYNFYLLSQAIIEFAPQVVEQIKKVLYSIP